MPEPQKCSKCDNIAVLLNNTTPYCVKCYRKGYVINGRCKANARKSQGFKGYKGYRR